MYGQIVENYDMIQHFSIAICLKSDLEINLKTAPSS